MADQDPRPLADLIAASGMRVPCASNQPLDLDEPQFAWFVERGAVDVFLVERQDGEVQSALHHMMRIEAAASCSGLHRRPGKPR